MSSSVGSSTERRRVAVLLVIAITGCNAPPARRPLAHSEPAHDVRIAASQSLGWLGFAPSSARDETTPGFLPVDATHPVVAVVEPATLTARSAIDTRGTVAQFTVGAPTKIRHGCDGNQLEVTPLVGPRLAPGVVWLMPPTMPASWRPSPLPIIARLTTPARRSYTIGPLAIALERTADLRGTLTITRAGFAIHTALIERQLMDGADDAPIDLAAGGPGIPEPVAAWSITTDAIFVVLHQPSYEGATLRALLVETSAARTIEAMDTYLYACAF